jgi:hypothetical protein
VIQAREQSGRALSHFAAKHGLKAEHLARWARRLGTRAVGRRGRVSAGAAPSKLRFQPLALIGTAPALKTSVIEALLLDGRKRQANLRAPAAGGLDGPAAQADAAQLSTQPRGLSWPMGLCGCVGRRHRTSRR